MRLLYVLLAGGFVMGFLLAHFVIFMLFIQIPQHRIVYFKRVSDGEIIWDKRKKIDLVFGSGVGAG